MTNQLNVYWVKEKRAEWSVLVFHYTGQQAKVLASQHWLTEFEYIDLRVRKASQDYMIFKQKDKPHIVDSWGDLYFDHDYVTWQMALERKKEVENEFSRV